MSEADGNHLVFSELDPLDGRGPELMRHTIRFADPRFANWALSPDGGHVALVNFADRLDILRPRCTDDDATDGVRLDGAGVCDVGR